MDLRKLIDNLKTPLSRSNNLIPGLDKVINNLEEMDSMIEMEDVKKVFVKQIMFILTMRKEGYGVPFDKKHIVLSGPPGVGKTTMSIMIAKTLASLDILDKKFKIKKEPYNTPSKGITNYHKKDIAHILTDILDNTSDIMLNMDNEFEEHEEENIPEYIKSIYESVKKSSCLCESAIRKYSKYFKEFDDGDGDEVDDGKEMSYVVLGREDFIAVHVGETSVKTQEVLDKHKGKIIIIEEAYMLFTNEKDSFGMEALTIINRYMDEKCDDYIFIFNGYIDMLDRTIFTAQPGLRRRIQWQFDIEDYTAKGVYKIFKRQLKKHKDPQWTIKDKDDICFEKFFIRNKHFFPYFGGDTEKLILAIKLAYGECFFDNKSHNSFIITYDLLEKGFKEFSQKRNISSNESIYSMYN